MSSKLWGTNLETTSERVSKQMRRLATVTNMDFSETINRISGMGVNDHHFVLLSDVKKLIEGEPNTLESLFEIYSSVPYESLLTPMFSRNLKMEPVEFGDACVRIFTRLKSDDVVRLIELLDY